MACARLAALVAVALLPAPLPAYAATASLGDELEIEKSGIISLTRDGTVTATDVQVRQGRGDRITRVSAAHLVKVDKPGKLVELNVTGAVHVEFRDTTLDADSAILVVRGEELVSVQVKGSQARFSHQPEGSARRINGRADTIDYEAATDKVSFTGNTFWTDGRAELTNRVVVYDIGDGSVVATDGAGILLPNRERERERVPGPRAPDRGSAQ